MSFFVCIPCICMWIFFLLSALHYIEHTTHSYVLLYISMHVHGCLTLVCWLYSVRNHIHSQQKANNESAICSLIFFSVYIHTLLLWSLQLIHTLDIQYTVYMLFIFLHIKCSYRQWVFVVWKISRKFTVFIRPSIRMLITLCISGEINFFFVYCVHVYIVYVHWWACLYVCFYYILTPWTVYT